MFSPRVYACASVRYQQINFDMYILMHVYIPYQCAPSVLVTTCVLRRTATDRKSYCHFFVRRIARSTHTKRCRNVVGDAGLTLSLTASTVCSLRLNSLHRSSFLLLFPTRRENEREREVRLINQTLRNICSVRWTA